MSAFYGSHKAAIGEGGASMDARAAYQLFGIIDDVNNTVVDTVRALESLALMVDAMTYPPADTMNMVTESPLNNVFDVYYLLLIKLLVFKGYEMLVNSSSLFIANRLNFLLILFVVLLVNFPG